MNQQPAIKTLDEKLSRIGSDPQCRDFILADAKDADMAFGLAATGVRPGGDAVQGPFHSIEDYRESIREIVKQGFIDIMLMSASTSEVLTLDEGLFTGSAVTPAVRMNDTTDIWLATGVGGYRHEPALPFSTTTIAQAQCGRIHMPSGERPRDLNLGLFSVTFNDDASLDRDMLTAYRNFRIESELVGFRHFLEVFFPNAINHLLRRSDSGRPAVEYSSVPRDAGRFLADSVVRALAGVPRAGRPLFLKIPYLGPCITEQLTGYDRSLVVGILGGAAGTTHDAYGLVADAKRYGARVALYGRKINAAEHQLSFVKFLRAVADDKIDATEAVKAYHGELQTLGIVPHRSLSDDLTRTSSPRAIAP